VRAGAYDRGQVLRDLVVMLAGGGDCVSDLASLRNQPEPFGQVVSTPTAWRVLAEELPADPRGDQRAVVGAGQGPRARLGTDPWYAVCSLRSP
jgi:hypothetical protein